MSFSPSVVVLGFSQADYTTEERAEHEGVAARVELLFGQLERSVAVWINSTQESTAIPGQGMCVDIFACRAMYFHCLFRL